MATEHHQRGLQSAASRSDLAQDHAGDLDFQVTHGGVVLWCEDVLRDLVALLSRPWGGRHVTEAEDPTSAAQIRVYTIGYARARLKGLFADVGIAQAIDDCWKPGVTVTRYGRRWFLTKVLESGLNYRIGKIGFVSEREQITLIFDEDTMDFKRGAAPSGTVVPFGIMTTDGTIAFQLRAGVVRESTFIGALRTLFSEARKEYIWEVRSLAEATTYDEWLPRVERVTNFNLRLERPNPHYHGDEIAERIIEELRLEYARLIGVERAEEGIDVGSDLFTQALDHVLRGYGRASLRALDWQGAESIWVKLKGYVGSVLARRRREAVGGDDAPLDIIREALFDPPRQLEELPLGDGDETSPT
jgi:hypothetical protein